jgi:hypothetical protein
MARRPTGNGLLAHLIRHADRQAERKAQRLLDKETDPELLAVAKELKRLAVGQSELFPLAARRRVAFQSRLPGL